MCISFKLPGTLALLNYFTLSESCYWAGGGILHKRSSSWLWGLVPCSGMLGWSRQGTEPPVTYRATHHAVTGVDVRKSCLTALAFQWSHLLVRTYLAAYPLPDMTCFILQICSRSPAPSLPLSKQSYFHLNGFHPFYLVSSLWSVPSSYRQALKTGPALSVTTPSCLRSSVLLSPLGGGSLPQCVCLGSWPPRPAQVYSSPQGRPLPDCSTSCW